jgi:putative endonuclease
MDARDVGRLGEEAACRLLEREGMRILERNVRFRRGEIDIVAQDGDERVFVEVRLRGTNPFQRAEESVGPRKLRRMLNAARAYVEGRGYGGYWRLDVVAVERDPSGALRCERFPDVTAGSVVA